MTVESFVQTYTIDMQSHIKENTWETKEHIISSKLLPYFGKRKMNEIQSKEIIAWQNEMINHLDEKGKHIRLCTSKRFTISSAPSSITLLSIIVSRKIQWRRLVIWAKRKARRCSFGQKPNMPNLPIQ